MERTSQFAGFIWILLLWSGGLWGVGPPSVWSFPCYSQRFNQPGFCVLDRLCQTGSGHFIWSQTYKDHCHRNGPMIYTCCPNERILNPSTQPLIPPPPNPWDSPLIRNWNPSFYPVGPYPQQTYVPPAAVPQSPSARRVWDFHQKVDETQRRCGRITKIYRIKNGKEALPGEYPWMALIQHSDERKRESFGCAGALIGERFVLTAAHCLQGRNVTSVHLGVHDISRDLAKAPRQIAHIEQLIIHPDYNRLDLQNDIALIKLQPGLSYQHHIGPICLPEANQQAPQDQYIAGWGLTERGSVSDVLMKASIYITPCMQSYGSLLTRQVYDGKICAGGNQGRNTCKGDSGGPLFGLQGSGSNQQFVMFGIVSGGLGPCSSHNQKPTMFTSVAKFRPWIDSHISESKWMYY